MIRGADYRAAWNIITSDVKHEDMKLQAGNSEQGNRSQGLLIQKQLSPDLIENW